MIARKCPFGETHGSFSCSNYECTKSNLDLRQGVERHQQAKAFDGAKKQRNANHGLYNYRYCSSLNSAGPV